MTISEVSVRASPIDFADQLRAQGYRLTPQRQMILDAVHRAGDHVTPDQVYETVHRQNPAISRATIYRTLDFLCEIRLVVAMRWGGQTYYEIAGETPHHHVICRTCGAVEELNIQLVEAFVESVWRKQRFEIDMNHMTVFGLCKQCRTAAKKTAR
ncbi:MAG: transcriptional repressor [Anaerolineae bacterium]